MEDLKKEVIMQSIIHGDCLEVMRTFEDNSFSCILTDPPYGLSFMGKDWDRQVPGIEFWKEMLRVVKPGGHILAMGGTRTFHRLTCAIEDAGWEIRDCLMWIYGSGFPKSHNNFGLEGYGTALKPSWEPIIMAMKPLDGTYKQNVEKWGQGGINIDECRIEGIQRTTYACGNIRTSKNKIFGHFNLGNQGMPKDGRWPANSLFDEQAAEMLDEQSGILKSGSLKGSDNITHRGVYNHGRRYGNINEFQANSGGASRFFYCAKASPSERGKENIHPTVKPLKLMEYLIKLVMPTNGIVLDPFCGSGTTLLAAKNLGFNAIGIELNEEYVQIAKKRIGV